MKKETALARARRGAAYLDKQFGPGWRKKIRRTKLNMGEGIYSVGKCGCVLSQLDYNPATGAGYYSNMADRLGFGAFGGYAVSLGFYTNDYDYAYDGVYGDYATLTEAWREVLREKPVTA